MNRPRGFTLIELAIVLVVIGLMAGLALGARTVIRTSELNSMTAQATRYVAAMKTFLDKYRALPGDMSNATTLWGAKGAGAACHTTLGSGTLTCNGNGDGKIGPITNLCPTCEEVLDIWPHLKNAGLIEGDYTGVAGASTVYQMVPGTNAPTTDIKGGGFTVTYIGTTGAADANYFAGRFGNVLLFGASTTGLTLGPILKPKEASSLDSKLDDGLPASGMIQAYKSTSAYTPNCTTTAVASTSRYNATNNTLLCNLVFITGL